MKSLNFIATKKKNTTMPVLYLPKQKWTTLSLPWSPQFGAQDIIKGGYATLIW